MKSDIIIIGAGAAGLMAAYHAGRAVADDGKCLQITVLEKMPRPGRKIMITGKGRCNFTNLKDWNDFSAHVQAGSRLAKSAFYSFPSQAVIDFFESFGMPTVVERGDRAFPASYRSSDVVDTLVNACNSVGVKILCEVEVTAIDVVGAARAGDDGAVGTDGAARAARAESAWGAGSGGYRLQTAGGQVWQCSKLIVATGGLSYPATGSTGAGLAWAVATGHSVAQTFPSLTALVPAGYKLPVDPSTTASVPVVAPADSPASVSCAGAAPAPATPPSAPATPSATATLRHAELVSASQIPDRVRDDAESQIPGRVRDDAESQIPDRVRDDAESQIPDRVRDDAACHARHDRQDPASPCLPKHLDRSLPLSETGELLCGIQLKNVQVTLSVQGTDVASEFGDIDFTDGGIEGPVGFQLSRKAVKALVNGSRVALTLDLKPAVSAEEVYDRVRSLLDEVNADPRSRRLKEKEKCRILLGKLIPWELYPAFKACHPDILRVEQRGRYDAYVHIDPKAIAAALKAWSFDIAGFVGYERAVITAGGVGVDSVVPKTLESRILPGLYFCGEVLDVDADTGGYNLQLAFCTGALAGTSSSKRS